MKDHQKNPKAYGFERHLPWYLLLFNFFSFSFFFLFFFVSSFQLSASKSLAEENEGGETVKNEREGGHVDLGGGHVDLGGLRPYAHVILS